MRTDASASFESALSASVTAPFMVVELVTPSVTYRWSTGPTIDWQGATWNGIGIEVENLRPVLGGGLEGTISLPNSDGAASAIVLGQRLSDCQVRIWKLYTGAPTDPDDGLALFEGVVDGQEIVGERARIDIVTEGRERELSPRLYFDAFCSHIPPAGTVVSWEGEHYKLEGRNG